VKHLQQRGLTEGVVVHPVGLRAEPVDWPTPASKKRSERLRSGGSYACFAVAVITLLAIGVWPPLAVAIAAAGASALAVALSWVARSKVRHAERVARLVRAERFEVRCEVADEKADHLLAMWWNADAPVAGDFDRGG
jgi:hypothetical protein